MSLFTDSILIDFAGIVLALALVIVTYIKWNFQYWTRRNIPVIQSTMDFSWKNIAKNRQARAETSKVLYEKMKEKNLKFCGTFNMLQPILVVADLDLIRHIVTKDFQYFTDRPEYVNRNEISSKSLFFKTGKDWHDLRSKLSTMFTIGKMRNIFPMVVNSGKSLETFIGGKCERNEQVDIKQVLNFFTLDIMASSVLGIDLNIYQNPNSPFMYQLLKVFNFGGFFSVLHFVITTNFPNLSQFVGIPFMKSSIIGYFSKTVTDIIEYREKNHIVRKDFLQSMLELKNAEMSRKDGDRIFGTDEFFSQNFGFFGAGFEPSAHMMTIALYDLALQPDIQEKLQKDINSVLEKYGGEITYEGIQEMTYLDQVFDETLRKYSASGLQRRCVKDYQIPGTDCVIEKGTSILIASRGVHFDPDYYPDPLKFDPDRFSEENKRKRVPYSYFPFGLGPRHCIGLRFGTLVSKVGIVCVLRNHKVSLSPETRAKLLSSEEYSQTVGTHGKIWLNLEKVDVK